MQTAQGPARTSIGAIAERAGVERLTVYRHFTEERALLSACTAHYTADNPLPDPGPCSGARDFEERLRRALAEVYSYYHRTEPMVSSTVRDAPLKPVVASCCSPP